MAMQNNPSVCKLFPCSPKGPSTESRQINLIKLIPSLQQSWHMLAHGAASRQSMHTVTCRVSDRVHQDQCHDKLTIRTSISLQFQSHCWGCYWWEVATQLLVSLLSSQYWSGSYTTPLCIRERLGITQQGHVSLIESANRCHKVCASSSL